MVLALADVTGLDLGYFVRTDDVPGVTFGLPPEDLAPWWDTVLAQARIWLENYLDIESYLPVEEVPLFVHPEPFPIEINSGKEAAAAAETLRSAWNLGPLPTPNLPEILEAYGVKVGLIDAPEEFEAASFWTTDIPQIPFIVARLGMPASDQRFAMARELSYLMLAGATTQTASHFAGSFLMPAASLRQDLGVSRTQLSLYELLMLKQKYGMSMKRLIVRATSLRIISREVMDEWLARFTEEGWDEEEPGEEPLPEIPARVVQMVVRLQAEGTITLEEAAGLVGTSPEEWDEILTAI
jgi:adenine deaminase